ncbi:hypothetical protein GGI12_000044 [Dipsacomyces acuminosporus]|nr:hypothetical protein GGI12_000044 [Dipsacomyces acuminosporus]
MTVTLGYAEPLDDEFFAEAFPSKIGGKPKWLDPAQPLNVDRVQCDECKHPMVLLMQLYAPEDEPAEAFHRMLYVFICRNGACHRFSASRCMRVFRSQIAEKNGIYEERSGSDDIEWVIGADVKQAHVCTVCGLAGTKACSKCHSRYYCSREHQIADWDAGHRSHCSGEGATGKGQPDTEHKRKLERMLYPEQVIASEEEAYVDDNEDEGSDDEDEDTEGIKPEDGALVPVTNEKVEDSQVDVDHAFLLFQRRIQQNADQVIRYARAPESAQPSEPLFVSDNNKPEAGKDVPKCGACGASREFEFQIMPQMLNFLDVDSVDPTSIDWGTLLIYSCPNSCSAVNESGKPAAYAEEAIARQNFSSQGIGEKYVRALHGDDSGFTKQFDSLNV